MSKKKEGKRGRKIGRNKSWCEAYRRSCREERNRPGRSLVTAAGSPAIVKHGRCLTGWRTRAKVESP